MTTAKTYSITINKSYHADIETIFNLFRNNTVFKLTGTNEIQSDFKTGGSFRLTFDNRGTIFGHFTKIANNEIILEWNVDGFQRAPEIKTIVEIKLKQDNENCILMLHHKDIAHEEAANAKQKAWTEILDDLEKEINKNDKD